MGTVRTDEFRKEAVRSALTSGLSRKQVADDLGVGMSPLDKWITAHRDTDVVSAEDRELALENETPSQPRSRKPAATCQNPWFALAPLPNVPVVSYEVNDRIFRTSRLHIWEEAF